MEPEVSHLWTFGSPVFVHIPDAKRRKLDPKATEGIMVGYGDSIRVYKIWDPLARNVITSRDVVFEEARGNCGYHPPLSFPSATSCTKQT